MRWFGLSSLLSTSITNDLNVSVASSAQPEFSPTLPFSNFVHHLSGPNTYVLTQTILKITECTHTQTQKYLCIYIQVIRDHQEHNLRWKESVSVVCDVM